MIAAIKMDLRELTCSFHYVRTERDSTIYEEAGPLDALLVP
jgi:hypothetical protein